MPSDTDSGSESGGFTAETLVQDRSEAVRSLDEAKIVLDSLPDEELNDREEDRLSTIQGKINDLREIVFERKVAEERAQRSE